MELIESEKKFKSLFQDSSVANIITNQIGKCIDINKAACELLGYTYDELVSENSISLFSELGLDPQSLIEKIRCKNSGSVKVSLLQKGGSMKFLECFAKPFREDSYLITALDITNKRKYELEKRMWSSNSCKLQVPFPAPCISSYFKRIGQTRCHLSTLVLVSY
jgi:PAS domain S-box-containing protein